ncbi:NAD(P)/FAD-dependent oxidoreductase [Chloroflexota bacterium]
MVVVGGGAVGSYVARRLAHMGHSLLLFEEHERIGEAVCCTGIIGKECFDSFPVAEGLILREANSAKCFSPSKGLLRLQKDGVQAYIVDRASFDIELARRAEEAGACYLLGSKVREIVLGDDRVEMKVETRDGGASFEAKIVVVASGFGPGLPRSLGLGEIKDFAMGAQAEVLARSVDEVEVYLGQGVAPGFFAWLVPTSGGRALAGLLSSRPPGPYLRNYLAALYHQGKIDSPEVGITYGRIPLKPLPRTYGARLVVVGDAAGQVKPTTGGGIYYGLLCAEIAVNTIHQALSTSDFSARQFSRYEKRWKRRLSWELRIGSYARRFYEKLSDVQIERIFDIIQSRGLHQAFLRSKDLSFDWHGNLILQVLRHEAIRQAIEVSKVPRRLRGLLFKDQS